MAALRGDQMKIEGEPLKRWCVNYGGELVGHWDTAHEAWDGYRNYEDKIRPVTDPGKKYRYTFRDGRKELDIIQFKAAIAAETRAATNTGDTSMSVGPVTSFAIESE